MSSMFPELDEETIEQRKIVRQPTGLASFDRSLFGGLILKSIYEIYGYTHVGKSTLSYFLAGSVRPTGKLMLADFEHYDPAYVESALRLSGFDGTVHEPRQEYGEQALEDIRSSLLDEAYSGAILDSVGALVTKAELEGELTDANMGLKARRLAPFMRQMLYALKRNPDACLFIINHLHAIMKLGNASTTHGGVAIHNNAHVRIRLSTEKVADEYQIVNGRIDKNRYGGKGADKRPFKFVLVPNVGVHPGLTAVQDCKWFGLNESATRIRINDTDYGYFKNLAGRVQSGEEIDFEPFHETLRHYLGADLGPDDPQDTADNEAE